MVPGIKCTRGLGCRFQSVMDTDQWGLGCNLSLAMQEWTKEEASKSPNGVQQPFW